MIIRTEETVTKYETWQYEVDALPDGFESWNGEDQSLWLGENTYDATLIRSDWAGLGTVDSVTIL